VRRDPATGQFLWPTGSDWLGLLEIEPRQDLFGIAGGSADFYNPEGGYPAETPYVNSPELLKKTILAVYASQHRSATVSLGRHILAGILLKGTDIPRGVFKRKKGCGLLTGRTRFPGHSHGGRFESVAS
jgi:hypothetical protein